MHRRSLWDSSIIDGHGTEGGAAPDGGILLPDHSAFQFDAPAPADTASDWSAVTIDVDFVDDVLQFTDTTDTTVSLVHDAPGETQTSSLTYEELSALYPNIVWPPLSDQIASLIEEILSQNPLLQDLAERAQSVFDVSWLFSGTERPPLFGQSATPADDTPPDTSSQGDAATGSVQDVGPAGLDWRITPDFDDDPGWQPGVIFPPSSGPDDGGLRPAAPAQLDAGTEPLPDADATSSADEPPLRDETQTSSLTLAELNEQYPGGLWPADWWHL